MLGLLLAAILTTAACGSDDDAGSEDAEDEAPSNAESVEQDATPSNSESEEEDAGEAQPGGKLVYGIESDTANPWTPANSTCNPSCRMVLKSVYDTLTLYGEDAEIHPNLLESFEPNEDFTEWTLTPRSGITFHDGTPFDAAAIKANLEAAKAGFVTSNALLNVETIELSEDGSSVVVGMTSPWAQFPIFLADQRQVGYMASPAWLAAVEAGTAEPTEPVGTGPFIFESYEAGGSFIATRNPDYWRADEGLPYLDEIEFRVIVDGQTRMNALLSGEIDIMHTSSGGLIGDLREEDSIELTESTAYGQTDYTLLNVGNPDSPLNDVRIRRALAMAIDRDVVIERRSSGIGENANGPFGPNQIGHLDETPYPEYDPAAAQALVDEYKADMGVDSVDISYTTTSDPESLETGELLRQFWDQVGINVELAQIEQGQFILTALRGDFEMFSWRHHGGVDPDMQRVWWHSETATNPPDLALNFGRINDEVIDANLDTLRATDDEAEIREAAEAINARFGEQVYNLWINWTVWGIAKDPSVNNIVGFTLPDGSQSLTGVDGGHEVAQLWVEQ